MNSVDIRRNIFFGTANFNPLPPVIDGNDIVSQGVAVNADGWTQVTTDAQIPLNSKGNRVAGDYELTYTAEAAFDFPGGGLLIGFQASPPAPFPDTGCEQVLVHTQALDSSENFYSRWYYKPDLTNGVLDDVIPGGSAFYLGGFILDDLIIPVDISIQPEIALNPVGTQHTLTATLTRGPDPVPAVEVTFEVSAGPNAGDAGIDTTDINGEAAFSYTGDDGAGVDEIEAWFVDDQGETVASNVALKFWDEDCQPNGIPDTCDIDCDGFDGFCSEFAGCGGSADDDANGAPDECNNDPICDAAVGAPDELWPPDHKFEDVSVEGVTDPDGDPVTITVTGVAQDEPLEAVGDGNTCPDATGVGTSIASVRAERSGTKEAPGDGRVYTVSFRADDGQGGECEGEVTVCVPHDQGQGDTCVNGGAIYDSTVCGEQAPAGASVASCGLGIELMFLLPPLVWLRQRRRRG